MLVIIALLVITFSLFSIAGFYRVVLFNGNPKDCYQPTRLLTAQELALLRHQYPKERFEPHIYQINGHLSHRSITIRSGRGVGFYDYYQLNELKVYISYMGTAELNSVNSEHGVYQLVRGKRKNYLVDVNGYNFFNKSKEWQSWFSCWEQARNDEATQKKRLRILGQRQPTHKEAKLLRKCYDDNEEKNVYAIGILLYLPLLFTLIALNFSDHVNLPLLLPIIGLCLGISYCFWLHPYLFPIKLGKINIIEGVLRQQSGTNDIYIGNLCCHISSQALINKCKALALNGKTRAVEVILLGNSYEIVNIEGVGNIYSYWQYYTPRIYYMHYLITGITCLILAGSLYGLRLQNYPYQDIWPWTGLNFNTNHIVTDPKQLDNVAEQSLLVQLKGEFEPYLESDGYFWPKLYWNSDPKPLLPAMVAPEGNRYISVNMLFIHKFKIQQGLITNNNYNYRVTFPQFDPLLEPYETYYQALFTAQRNNGAILTIYGPQPSSLPSYQLSDNAVTILNNISQRNNRKPLEINGELTSFFSISSDGTRQKEYHIIINPERFRMIKINGFNLLLILLYTIPALLFSVGCIMMNKVNASRRV